MTYRQTQPNWNEEGLPEPGTAQTADTAHRANDVITPSTLQGIATLGAGAGRGRTIVGTWTPRLSIGVGLAIGTHIVIPNSDSAVALLMPVVGLVLVNLGFLAAQPRHLTRWLHEAKDVPPAITDLIEVFRAERPKWRQPRPGASRESPGDHPAKPAYPRPAGYRPAVQDCRTVCPFALDARRRLPTR